MQRGPDSPYIVTEPAGKNIRKIIEESGPFSEVEALQMTKSIARALQYIHQHNHVYQMVEPGSVYPSEGLKSMKLGWLNFCCPIGTNSQERRTFSATSAAPEIYSANQVFETSTDIFGLGAILFFALTGHFIYSGKNINALALQSKKGIDSPLDYTSKITAPTVELIHFLCSIEQNNRPKIDEAIGNMDMIIGRLK